MDSDNGFDESTYNRYLILDGNRRFVDQIFKMLHAFDSDFAKLIHMKLGDFTKEDLEEDLLLAAFVSNEIEILSEAYGKPVVWEDGEVYLYIKK